MRATVETPCTKERMKAHETKNGTAQCSDRFSQRPLGI